VEGRGNEWEGLKRKDLFCKADKKDIGMRGGSHNHETLTNMDTSLSKAGLARRKTSRWGKKECSAAMVGGEGKVKFTPSTTSL